MAGQQYVDRLEGKHVCHGSPGRLEGSRPEPGVVVAAAAPASVLPTRLSFPPQPASIQAGSCNLLAADASKGAATAQVRKPCMHVYRARAHVTSDRVPRTGLADHQVPMDADIVPKRGTCAQQAVWLLDLERGKISCNRRTHCRMHYCTSQACSHGERSRQMTLYRPKAACAHCAATLPVPMLRPCTLHV